MKPILRSLALLVVAGFALFGAFGVAVAQSTSLSTTSYPATSISASGAILNGYVQLGADSNVKNVDVWFEWGPDTGMSFATSKSTIYLGGTFTGFAGPLKKNTTYYFRAAAQAGGTISYGTTLSFTTQSNTPGNTSGGVTNQPEIVSTYTATNVTDSYATLNGNIDPRDATDVERWFEWGESTSLGQSTPHERQPDGIAENFSRLLTSLKPNTIYYYRAVAQGSGGLIDGNTFAFRTTGSGGVAGIPPSGTPTLPTITTLPATALTTTSAAINGLISPDTTTASTVWFEWGVGGNVNQKTAQTALTSPAGQTFTQVLGGLSPNTIYSFRAVIQTGISISYGATRTFTTNATGGAGQSSSSGGTSSATTGTNTNTNTTGNGSTCEKCSAATTTQGGSSGNGGSLAIKIILWLLVVLLVLIIVIVWHHFVEMKKRHAEEQKKAEVAEKLREQTELTERNSDDHNNGDTITFKLPGQ